MKIAACLLSAKQLLSFFQHFDQNCNKPNNKPYHDHQWRLLLSRWAPNEGSSQNTPYKISHLLLSQKLFWPLFISFAINLAASIPWDQANFIGCHKVIWQITKQLIDRSIGFQFAKHSRVYKWHSLKFSLKRAKILNFTYSKVQTMFKAKDFVWRCSFTYVSITSPTCHRHSQAKRAER